ncbi:hypothetical protein AOH105_01380 [Helicobacter pylori]
MEGESDKIFLILLNEIKNLRINSQNIVSRKGNTKLFKEAEGIKEYLKAKDIYIVFDSDNQKRETKIQEIKKQLQETPEEEHRLNDEEFNQIKIFLLPENDESQHNPKYCELEHLLEKMAKESENKAFYTSFRQHYNALCVNSKKSIRIKHLSEESKKNAPNAGYTPISRFLFV